jgi:MoaA/NifB/PqqE/SkfB family radical SAM enzyme
MSSEDPFPETRERNQPDFPSVPPLPRHLQVEVTSACNLRCAMCLVRYRPPINKLEGAIDAKLFYRLLDDLPELERLTLQGLGEPLLHPRLLEFIAFTHDRGTKVGFNTNATLLSRSKADALVAAGLDWLHVSLDGASAATYESIRDGARLPVVLRNLAGLSDARARAGVTRPHIQVVFVAMRRNVEELPSLVRLLDDIGVSDLRVQNLSHDFADTDPAGGYREIREYAREQSLWDGDAVARRAFAEATGEAVARGIRLRLPYPAEARRPLDPGAPGCTWPWDAAYITSQGIVQPCCMVMGDDRVALGCLTEASFAEIWSGPAYVEFRQRLLSGAPPEVCRGCALYRGTF